MLGRNHFASGVVTGSLVATATHLPPDQAVLFIGLTSACALLPDFDHPSAMLPRMFLWPGRALAGVIGGLFGHRTLTHSVLGVGLLSAGLAFIPHLPAHCYWAVIVGCVTHILGDMLTVSGVPVFWPHERAFRLGWVPEFTLHIPPFRPVRVGRMRTGKSFERLVVTPLLAVGAMASVGLVVATSA